MAALVGTGLSPSSEQVEVWCFSENLSARLVRTGGICFKPRFANSYKGKFQKVRCLSSKALTPLESEDSAQSFLMDSVEEEAGHVIKFKMSDFNVLDRVSIGLGGRVWRT